MSQLSLVNRPTLLISSLPAALCYQITTPPRLLSIPDNSFSALHLLFSRILCIFRLIYYPGSGPAGLNTISFLSGASRLFSFALSHH